MASFLEQYQQQSSSTFRNPNRVDYDPLKLELGWREVSVGLTRMIIGHTLTFLCVALSVGLTMYLAANNFGLDDLGTRDPDIGLIWTFYAGSGLISIMSLASTVYLLVGFWKCAIFAPERAGSKLFVVLSLLFMLITIVIAVTWGISMGIRTPATSDQFFAMLASVADQALVDTIMLFILYGLSLTSMALFVMFIRSIGKCFNNKGLVSLVDFYLLFAALLIGFSGYLAVNTELVEASPMVGLAVSGGKVVSWIANVTLIVAAKVVLMNGIRNIKSPLDPS